MKIAAACWPLSAIAPPPASGLVSPLPNSTLSGSTVTFGWLAVPGADNYLLQIGLARGGNELFDGLTQSLTQTVGKLPCEGQNVWVRITARADGVWLEPRDHLYVAASSCSQ